MKWFLTAICALFGAALVIHPLVLSNADAYVIGVAACAWIALVIAAFAGAWSAAVMGGLFLVAEYAIALILRDTGIDQWSALLAAGLLLELELLDLVRFVKRTSSIERAVIMHRLRFLVGATLAGLFVSAAALLAGAATTGNQPVALLVGSAAALGSVWMITALARGKVGGG
jgi:hypothetical protein